MRPVTYLMADVFICDYLYTVHLEEFPGLEVKYFRDTQRSTACYKGGRQ